MPVFDRDQILKEIGHCSRCGSCRVVCPTFAVTHHELRLARGRLQLIRSWLQGHLESTRELKMMLDTCLLCGLCAHRCPNGVPVDETVIAVRQRLAQEEGVDFSKRLLLAALGSNRFLSAWARLLLVADRTGLRSALNDSTSAIGPLVPPAVRDLAGKVPPGGAGLPARKGSSSVVYYPGCLPRYLQPQVGHATLALLGQGITVPDTMVCCGMPAWGAGDRHQALALARSNLDLLATPEVETIVVDCPTCAKALRSYSKWFAAEGDGARAEAARDMGARVVHIAALFQRGAVSHPVVGDGSGGLQRIFYHNPCHMNCDKGDPDPDAIGTALVEAGLGRINPTIQGGQESSSCCGAAGSFTIFQPGLSRAVSGGKVEEIVEAGAEIIVTSCPLCRQQIESSLRREGHSLPVFHISEFLCLAR